MPDATGVKTQDERIEELEATLATLVASVDEVCGRVLELEKTNKAKTTKEKVAK